MCTTDNSRYKIVKEALHENDEISAACMMAADAECNIDIRTVVRGIVTLPNQTHSLNVGVVESPGNEFTDTDALLCFHRATPVGVVTADCVPMVIYAPDIKGVGAIHAGWRGTLGGIVENVLDVLEAEGADMSLLQVFFGPSISVARYEVGEELAGTFISAGFAHYVVTPDEGSRPHVDLQGINRYRFMHRGVPDGNIRLHTGCSYDSRIPGGGYIYQSHRRSMGNAGRMLTYIVMP